MKLTIGRRPYKQVARAQAQQRTRDALMEVATEEFFGNRWPKTSLEALAAKAGTTKQTLLRHFGSKDGLLLQGLIKSGSQLLDQRWSAPVGDVPGAVENLLDHYEAWGERSLKIGAWLEGGSALLARMSLLARQVHYEWVDYAFAPWLESLPAQARARRRAALIAICDVHTWRLLSHDLGLERAEVKAILVDTIERVVVEAR